MEYAAHMIAVAMIAYGCACFARDPGSAPLRPVSFTDVNIDDDFWAPRLAIVAEKTLPHCFDECEQTGRLRNFDKAAGKLAGEFEGRFYDDSDVYKVLEGASYALMHERDPKLEAYVDGVIARIAAAQQENGYLNTYIELTPDEQPWSNCRVRHELYCAGHLLEAAIAHYQATGKRTLLDVALKYIDLIDNTFGPDKRHDIPGHEEIELALIKLYRLTGEKRYLKLAEFFIEERGRADGRELYGEYCQDYAPVREHTWIVGHAVRAMYFYSGVADLAAIDHDAGLIDMLERIWRDTADSKMYVIGGLGSSRSNEGFTKAYDLPNEEAYCETCAAIALCFWTHRLNLLHADASYFDVFERALYNNVLAGISLDGVKFFYVNPLASRGDHHRQAWYSCACCPSNIVRFIASVGQYVYALGDDAIFVNLYLGSTATVKPNDDLTVKIKQETSYPWDGNVKLRLEPSGSAGFDLYLRIPSWCVGAGVTLNGKAVAPLQMHKGYARLHCEGMRSYVVELNLPMPIERVEADPRVTADIGRVALQRGPVVYCLEGADNETDVSKIALPREAKLEALSEPQLLGGVTLIRGDAITPASETADGWDRALYTRAPAAIPTEFTAIPYYAWDNRDAGPMTVWLPESLTLIQPERVSWITPDASHCYSGDSTDAMCDKRVPETSDDKSVPRFTWWPRRGTLEWVSYKFDEPRTVASVAVYWFDDSAAKGHCRAPASWKLLYRDGDKWIEAPNASGYGVALNEFNRTTFDSVKTDALKLEVQLQDDQCAGIMEWKVGVVGN